MALFEYLCTRFSEERRVKSEDSKFRFQSKATRGKTNSTHRNSVPIPYQFRTKSHLYSGAIRGHGEVLQLSLLTIKPEMPGAAKGIKHPSLWEICRKTLRPKGEKA